MDHAFQYQSSIQEIPRIRKDLEFLKTEWTLPASEYRQILVIIEEIFSNIVRYAYNDSHDHRIDILLNREEGRVNIEIIDDGIAFDPLDYRVGPQKDPAAPDTGGMGLTLIRAFSSQISYERVLERNHLKITKKVKEK